MLGAQTSPDVAARTGWALPPAAARLPAGLPHPRYIPASSRAVLAAAGPLPVLLPAPAEVQLLELAPARVPAPALVPAGAPVQAAALVWARPVPGLAGQARPQSRASFLPAPGTGQGSAGGRQRGAGKSPVSSRSLVVLK